MKSLLILPALLFIANAEVWPNCETECVEKNTALVKAGLTTKTVVDVDAALETAKTANTAAKAAVTEAEKAVTSTAEAATTAKADVETKTAAVATAQTKKTEAAKASAHFAATITAKDEAKTAADLAQTNYVNAAKACEMQAAEAAAAAASLAEAKRLAGVENGKQAKLLESAEQQVAAEASGKTAADAALVTAAEEVTAAEKAVATATTTATSAENESKTAVTAKKTADEKATEAAAAEVKAQAAVTASSVTLTDAQTISLNQLKAGMTSDLLAKLIKELETGAEVTLDSALVTGTTDITKYQYMNNLVETLGTSHLVKLLKGDAQASDRSVGQFSRLASNRAANVCAGDGDALLATNVKKIAHYCNHVCSTTPAGGC